MVLLVSPSGIRYKTEYPGLGSTNPHIILLYEELSSLSLRYVYTEDAFYDGDLGGDVL